MSNGDERVKGKAEEIKGKVKAGIGTLTGNEELEAEGQVDQVEGQGRQEGAKAAERVKGAGEEISGKLRGAVGKITGNEQEQADAKAEELKGKARKSANH
ncbi:MAG: CsbD family protein [Oscillochloris sp.]|nr:CsbD family protein [Oscillochloris sp.]